MSDWERDELERIGDADELELTARRPDGTVRKPVTIWVVRVGDDLYVRSWRGRGGRWFRAAEANPEGHVSGGGADRDVVFLAADEDVNDAIDAVYRAKYGRYGDSYVSPMVGPEARATTLRLVPRGAGAS
jgi:hypothetical protein